jgi:hypothetical protein
MLSEIREDRIVSHVTYNKILKLCPNPNLHHGGTFHPVVSDNLRLTLVILI